MARRVAQPGVRPQALAAATPGERRLSLEPAAGVAPASRLVIPDAARQVVTVEMAVGPDLLLTAPLAAPVAAGVLGSEMRVLAQRGRNQTAG